MLSKLCLKPRQTQISERRSEFNLCLVPQLSSSYIHKLQNSEWSALFFSSQDGHLKIAELLIAAGAIVDRKDKVTVNVCALY